MTAILDDFDELNDLLADSLKLADARKAVKRAKANNGIVAPELADIAAAAEAALRWTPQAAVARFVEEHCNCGASHRRFDGWFILSQHRQDQSARRLVRSDSHENLPAWHYVAEEVVSECAECLDSQELPLATPDFLLGVDALGQAFQADHSCAQLDFNDILSVEDVVLITPEELFAEGDEE